tara:strand:+ start:847 stop:2055 length:1209 start_codon:yes stop_codon:yes gene_type:complete
MINKCEICGQKKLLPVLSLGSHPLCDDLIKVGSNKKSKLHKIEIIFCKDCIIAYQKYPVSKKTLFPKNYHYRSKFTKDVITGMKEVLNKSKNLCGSLRNKVVLDIGCNDGSLLDFFKKKGAITVGIEPTNAADEAKSNGHAIYKSYFDKNTVLKVKKKYKQIDIIAFTNVFAHIENLRLLIKNLKQLISKDTYLIIENHYLGSVIKKKQFDTFYHEHPRTYSLQSFLKISKLLNANLINYSFPKRYGGNIRVIYSRKNFFYLNIKKNRLKKEKKYFVKLKNMKIFINRWKFKKGKLLENLVKKHGALPAKGFPGRAAILIKLLNLDKNHLRCVHEQNMSNKVGHYVPGTKIPIVPDKQLKKLNKTTPIINLAWHIKDEIKKYLIKKNIRNKVIEVLEHKDFK